MNFVHLVVALGLLALSSADIYPDDHWMYSTQMTTSTFKSVIKLNVDEGRTLFVRWIPSESHVECIRQAPAWNEATEMFLTNPDVAFADVNLDEESVQGTYEPGTGGWPTIMHFNKQTGYEGKPYNKKTKLAMWDELGPDNEFMQKYIEKAGKTTRCSVVTGAGCTHKEKLYLEQWKPQGREKSSTEFHRLKEVMKGRPNDHHLDWLKQRSSILKNLALQKDEL